MDREAPKQRSQQAQPQQSPGSGAQGNQPQTGTNQPSPSQQQDDERVASQIDDAPQGHSRAIVPCQSLTPSCAAPIRPEAPAFPRVLVTPRRPPLPSPPP